MRILLASFLALAACSREAVAPTIAAAPEPPTAKTTEQELPSELEPRARFVVEAFRKRDLAAVARVVHPAKGVRFSPYAFVEPSHLTIAASDLVARHRDRTVSHFGEYDGSGDPIDLTFAQYIDKFVYDVDFATAPKVAIDKQLSHGNTIANHREAYPAARFVELHFDGFEKKYEGMDWRSLRLAFEQHEGAWMLVGVIHDEWTI